VPRALTVALVLSLSSLTLGTVASADPVIPSQQDVDRAKAAVNVAAGSVAEIESAYAAASSRMMQLQTEAGVAASAAASARALLDERVAAATTAGAAAQEAAAGRAKADRSLRRTAAQIYQEQGSLSGIGVYLESGGPQDVADRTAALSIVGDLRQQALTDAAAAANVQAEAERNATLARTQQTEAAAAADRASASADQLARSAGQETARIQAEQQQRLAALAAARQTSVEVEQSRQDGLARKAAEEAAARKAAEEAAIQARIQAEQAEHARAAREAAAKEAAAKAAVEAAAKAAASQAPKPATPAPAPKPKPVPVPPVTAPAPPPASSGSGYSTTAYKQAYLGTNANAIYSAIRSYFGITNIGGYRAGDWGDHGAGNAVDVMTRSFAEGDAVAAFAQSHSREFGVKYIIWKQRIWFPGNSADTWRWMADRGSITENHYDHVHISVY
jgi:glucan-binding YG repeat protein